MKRRSVLLLPPLAALAGCGSPGVAEPRPSTAAPLDYSWPDRHPGLTSGFCFTLVRGITPYPLIEKLHGEELERVEWPRVLGPGDGEAGVRTRFFVGMIRTGNWTVVVEDNGSLGVTPQIVQPLSAKRWVFGYRGGGGKPGRLMIYRDGDLALDLDTSAPERAIGSKVDEMRPDLLAAGLSGKNGPAEPTPAALTFLAARTRIKLAEEWLKTLSYLLVAVPKP
ncbi:DUF6461 domain-containing protein [Actinoplanes philippinensis]|uniref:DUF6461 domain-containing protein n=1 Tax=Actinoplanes philippinensis TaxID=35752 RepID=UPI00340C56DB